MCLAIFRSLYFVQDPFTDYLLCILSDERVAGHYKRITQENIHMDFVYVSQVCGQAFRQIHSQKIQLLMNFI